MNDHNARAMVELMKTDPKDAMREFTEAFDSWKQCRETFPERTLTLAFKLQKLRDTHRSNKAFGAALEAAGYGNERLSHQDRAALLAMVSTKKRPDMIEITREVLNKTERWSPQHIYAMEIKPLLEPAEPEKGNDGEETASTRTKSEPKNEFERILTRVNKFADICVGTEKDKWSASQWEVDPKKLAKFLYDQDDDRLTELLNYWQDVFTHYHAAEDERQRLAA
jgi:hypothetical protein